MGEAAVLEMYFNAMPEIAKSIAEPLTKADRITMYGDGNSAKLAKDIMTTLTQVTDGLKNCSPCRFPAFRAAVSKSRTILSKERNAGSGKNRFRRFFKTYFTAPSLSGLTSAFLADFRTRRHLLLRYHQGKLSVFVLRAKQHSLRNDSCQGCRLQIDKHHNTFSDHLLRSILCLDAGHDLLYLIADPHLGAQQLF